MGTLVSDLLDLARNDSGRLQLQLAATLEPPVALADPHRLQQCLTALVDNALLYTDGSVVLTASSGADFQLLLPPVKPLGPIS